MKTKNNCVYIIHAHEIASNQPDWIYAVANSYELAEKIAKQDEADGQIEGGWTISETYLNTSESD